MILPAFNEEAAIPIVIADLRAALGEGVEIVVVDDGSTDRTAAVASEHGATVVSHEVNMGKGSSMISGVAIAGGDHVVFMDADATYPAAAIPQLIGLLSEYDIVRGERALDSENIPAVNRLGNRVFNRLIGAFHQIEGKDIMSGLYGMSRDAFQDLRLESAGFDIEVEIGIKARQRGLSVGTFDIEYNERVGEKKLSPLRDGITILMRAAGIALLYSPTVTFVIPGLLIMGVGIVGAVLLAGGPLFIGSIGLSINSYVLALLGVIGGFQLVVFGVAATLYRVETGVAPKRWLIVLAKRSVRLGAALVGVALGLLGAVWLIALVVSWVGRGAGDFLETDQLVGAASAFVLGLQLMSGGLFLSIFSGRLAARRG